MRTPGLQWHRGSVLAIIVAVFQALPLHAQDVRPIRDSIGFCWNADEMTAFVKYLDVHAEPVPSPPGTLVGAISVHDDYLYAGTVYHALYSKFRAKEVVIFGVTHGSVTRELGPLSNVVILDDYDRWRGPYKDVRISPLRSIIRKRLRSDEVLVSNRAHDLEHSIEALLPFLQYYNRDVTITPIMVTRMPLERMQEVSVQLADIFAEYISAHQLVPGKDIVFLMSNDANHYGPDFNNDSYGTDAHAHRLMTENDRRIIGTYLTGEIIRSKVAGLTGEIWPDSTAPRPIPIWCGRYPITLGLLTVTELMQRLGGKTVYGSPLKYSDSFTEGVLPFKESSMGLTAVFSYRHWCGWFTEGLYIR